MGSYSRCLMVQGTSSHAGKSILVTALCRILAQDGWKVAPFKSQNMSLNSFVTAQGGEMGRAQVLQAMAAGIAPHTDMNPILLKPTSEKGAQVVLNGKVAGHLQAGDYHRGKLDLLPHALAALERLRSQFEIVVLEGAGSPAEINLRDGDIVNMRMAKAAKAPVLLVGDIDRGGVIASLVGTMELLRSWERRMVRGLVINKFRGERELLETALEFLKGRTKKPVLGVIPFIRDLGLDEEDTVNLESARLIAGDKPQTGGLDLAVIHFPHISNATDFQPLEHEPGVKVRYVKEPGCLGMPDCVILPGSKNVGFDLSFLRNTGLAEALARLVRLGVPLLGICGGYQMLGRSIEDPEGVEFGPGLMEGLGLLPVKTVMASVKSTHQVKAVARRDIPWLGLDARQPALSGYEIHMGVTQVEGEAVFAIVERDGKEVCIDDGASHGELPVFGCYLHGLFDNADFRGRFLNLLREKRGLAEVNGSEAWERVRERKLDRLADIVRASMDMSHVYSLLGVDEDRKGCG